MEQHFKFRKVRDFGTVMNDSFDFIRLEFKRLGKTILIYVLPFFVITGILLAYSQISLFSTLFGDTSTENAIASTYLKMIPGYVVMLLNYTVLTAIIYQYINLYEKRKGDFEPEEMWPGILPIVLKMFVIYLISFVIVVIASMFFLIPGIYLGIVFSFLPAAVVFEELSFGKGSSRSFEVIKNNWWKTFGIIILGILIVYVIGIVFSIPLIITTAVKTFHAVSDNAQPQVFSTSYIIFSTIISIIQNLAYSLVLIFVAVQYFSLVEKKERPTLQDKIDKLAEETNE